MSARRGDAQTVEFAIKATCCSFRLTPADDRWIAMQNRSTLVLETRNEAWPLRVESPNLVPLKALSPPVPNRNKACVSHPDTTPQPSCAKNNKPHGEHRAVGLHRWARLDDNIDQGRRSDHKIQDSKVTSRLVHYLKQIVIRRLSHLHILGRIVLGDHSCNRRTGAPAAGGL